MNEEYNLTSLIKMIIIIVLIMITFYGLTILITKKAKNNNDDNKTTTNTEIQYDEILIGNIYDQKEEEYYVLAELSSDYLTLNSIITTYNTKTDKIKLYIADLNNGFNKKYIGEQSNFENKYPTFSKSTLLKIKDKQIVEYSEGTDKIQEKLR